MGKITDALKKAAGDRIDRLEKISHIQQRERLIVKKIKDSSIDPRLVTYFDSKALVAEQYKILRTNLLSVNKKQPLKALTITSSTHSEGKSITSLNLAVTMAQSIQKHQVLLIDADLRRGRVHKYLGVDQDVGLTEILEGQTQVEDAIFKLDIDNLNFIACGSVPENPAELLSSDKMRNLLQHVKKQFDFIIIDTPPVISVTDAGIIGAQTDGVLVVVKAGVTQRNIIKRAEELLYQSHSKVLGHVLTNIEYHLPEYIYRYL